MSNCFKQMSLVRPEVCNLLGTGQWTLKSEWETDTHHTHTETERESKNISREMDERVRHAPAPPSMPFLCPCSSGVCYQCCLPRAVKTT